MTQATINGNTYSDDGTSSKDMLNGGHRTHFIPMVGDVAAVAGVVATQAAQTANDAANAANGALATKGTSTTSLAVSAGSKSITTQSGKQFTAGNFITISRTSAPTTLMHGVVTAYSGTALTVEVSTISGSGNYTDWTIALSGAQGAQGPSGNGVMPYAAKTSAYTVVTTDRGSLIDCTSGTFVLSFQGCATLGADWACYIRNSGTGVITLDPNGAETIDGAATFSLPPNTTCMLQCDGTALAVVSAQPVVLRRMPIFSAGAATATGASVLEGFAVGATSTTGLTGGQNVCFGNSLFLADSGSAASIASSPDGITWTLRTMPSTATWRVETDGTNFLAVDGAGTNVTASSTNGTTWIAATNLPGTLTSGKKSPIVGLSGVWLVQGSAANTFYRSTNLGVSWSTETAVSAASNAFLTKVNGKFWYIQLGTNTAYYSTTGLTSSWTSVALPITPTQCNRSCDNNIYFATSTVDSDIYQLVNETTFTLVSGATVTSSNGIPNKINGVWGASVNSATIGTSWTLHNGVKVARLYDGFSMITNKFAGSGGTSVMVSTTLAATYTDTRGSTALFTR